MQMCPLCKSSGLRGRRGWVEGGVETEEERVRKQGDVPE